MIRRQQSSANIFWNSNQWHVAPTAMLVVQRWVMSHWNSVNSRPASKQFKRRTRCFKQNNLVHTHLAQRVVKTSSSGHKTPRLKIGWRVLHVDGGGMTIPQKRRFDQLPSLKLTASASRVQMKFPFGAFLAYFSGEIFLPRFVWAHLRKKWWKQRAFRRMVSTHLKILVKLANFPK